MFGIGVHVGDSDGRSETLLLNHRPTVGPCVVGEAGKSSTIRSNTYVILAENIIYPFSRKKRIKITTSSPLIMLDFIIVNNARPIVIFMNPFCRKPKGWIGSRTSMRVSGRAL